MRVRRMEFSANRLLAPVRAIAAAPGPASRLLLHVLSREVILIEGKAADCMQPEGAGQIPADITGDPGEFHDLDQGRSWRPPAFSAVRRRGAGCAAHASA